MVTEAVPASCASLEPRRSPVVTVALELLVGFAILLLAEWTATGSFGQSALRFHPYWLVVLPAASLRGLAAGLTAASLGSLLLCGGLLHRAVVDTPAAALLQVGATGHAPAFVLVAFLLGWLHDERFARRLELWHRLCETTLDREGGALVVERLLGTNRKLKLRLLDQTAQFGDLVHAAEHLHGADPGRAHHVLLELVATHCGASACSVIRLDRHGRPRISVARSTDPTHPANSPRHHVELEEAAARSELVAAVLRDRRAYDAFAPDAPQAGDGPLAVAPLLDRDGRVRALLCIHELPVTRFTSATTSILAGLAAFAVQAAPSGNNAALAADPAERLGSTDQLLGALARELGRARLQNEPAAVLAIRLEDRPEAMEALAAEVVAALMHDADQAFRTDVSDGLVVVLPGTDRRGAGHAARRLVARIRRAQPDGAEGLRVGLTMIDREHARRGLTPLLDELAEVFGVRPTDAERVRRPEVGDLEDFLQALRIESNLACRTGHPLWIASLRVPDERDPALEESLAATAPWLQQPAAVYRLAHDRIALLLPGVDSGEAFLTARAFEQDLALRRPEQADDFDVQVYAIDDANTELRPLIERILHELPADGPGLGFGAASRLADTEVLS